MSEENKNPLFILADQMGLNPADLVQISGVTPEEAGACLAPDPSPLSAFFTLCRSLGIRFTVEGVKGFSFTVESAAMEGLFFDRLWREGHSLLPAGRTLGELWAILKTLKPLGPTAAANELIRSIVPTGTGQREWYKTVVQTTWEQQQSKAKEINAMKAIAPDAQCLKDWRSFVSATLLAEICPMSFLPEFKIAHGETSVGFSTDQAMPKAIVERMKRRLEEMPWVGGRWEISSSLRLETSSTPE